MFLPKTGELMTSFDSSETRLGKSGNATFLRLDNAAIVDFLTSTAGALSEKGLINAKDTDNLRLVLSGIQSLAGSRESPVMLELLQQNTEFLTVLTARFGTEGLCLNLLRHTLRPHLVETVQALADWGQRLLKKSELLFNRPFYIYSAGTCDKQTLYATVLIDLSEVLGSCCEKIERVTALLATMNPHDMAGGNEKDAETDASIAKALGFKGVTKYTLPAHEEVTAKKELSQALLTVAEAAANLAEQLTANCGHQAGYTVLIACDWLTAECQRLDHLEIPKTSSITAWEVRRRNLTACLASINEALREVAASSLDATSQQMRHSPFAVLPEAAKRRVAFDLMTTGVQPAKAWEATEDLFRYLQEKSIKPHELIVSELARINQLLLPRSMDLLASLVGDNLMHGASADKKINMTRSKRLTETFVKAATLLALFLTLFTATGCGLKTAPKSDVLDLRPDIPYRNNPLSPPTSPKLSTSPQTVIK
jgi:hypothetical protein